MSRRRRRQLLVPEARAALDELRNIVIDQQTNSPSQAGTRTTQRNPLFGSSANQARQDPLSTTKMGVSENTGVGDVASQLGIPYQHQDNGDMTTRQAGKIGGAIGGSMVQRLIQIAEQELAKEQAEQGRP